MSNIIKYIGYYDTSGNSIENRGYSLAATTKMNYICKAINQLGFKVLIVSPSKTSNKKFYRGKQIKIDENNELKLFSTFPSGNKLQRAFNQLAGDLMLFSYLMRQVEKGEIVIVYHSLGLKNIVTLAKKIKKFEVILEVEEIYQDVITCSSHIKKLEYKMLDSGDKFIFPTELLNKKINTQNKPYALIHGTYQVEEDRQVHFGDDKIHIVYAGTFEPKKGGALAAAAAAQYLPENYHIHIIGFGSDKQIKNIKQNVKKINNISKATVTYDGLLKGEDYIRFLQKCHIGLSTQDPKAKYNDTSFPSKILSYMANGLKVVTVRIAAIETSLIGDKVYYYEEQNPKAIAKAILDINLEEKHDSRTTIKDLDKLFKRELEVLLR